MTRIAVAVVSEPASLVRLAESSSQVGYWHLNKNLGFSFFLSQAVRDEWSEHVSLNLLMRSKSFSDDFFGDAHDLAKTDGIFSRWKQSFQHRQPQEFAYPRKCHNQDNCRARFFHSLNVLMVIWVCLSIPEGLTEGKGGDDIQGKVLSFTTDIYWLELGTCRDILLIDEPNECLYNFINSLFQINVLFPCVLLRS